MPTLEIQLLEMIIAEQSFLEDPSTENLGSKAVFDTKEAFHRIFRLVRGINKQIVKVQ